MRMVNLQAGQISVSLHQPVNKANTKGLSLAPCFPVHAGLAVKCLDENKLSSLTDKGAACVSCRSTKATTLAGKDLKDSVPALQCFRAFQGNSAGK